MPADLRRAVIDTYDVGVAPKLAKGARLTRDTTRAQLYFKSVEQGLARPLRSRILDSPAMRRVLARFGDLETETAAAANIAREIQVAGKQALRTLKAKLDKRIELHGDFNKALEELLVEELTAAGETPTEPGTPCGVPSTVMWSRRNSWRRCARMAPYPCGPMGSSGTSRRWTAPARLTGSIPG